MEREEAEMSGQNTDKRYLLEEYRSRINRVIDYIESNIDRDLKLQELADVAGFSRFHFHRIFSSMIGETLYNFIQRIRLEKAANKLVQNPRKSITGIALECGFTSSSAFGRAFRDMFAMSASDWRSGGYKRYGNNGIAESNFSTMSSKIRQEYQISYQYNRNQNDYIWRIHMKKDSTMKADVEVKIMPEFTVAYIRHIGPYKGDVNLFQDLFNRLMKWAGARGLLSQQDIRVMTLYYDDPELTDDTKLRLDVCITVPEGTKVDGEVGLNTIPAGKYAIAHFSLRSDEFQDAWNAIYSGWLPESGYQPADGPCYELCLDDMNDISKDRYRVDIYVPVKPL